MKSISEIDLITLVENDLGQGHKSGRWMLYHCPFSGHTRGDKNPSLTVTNGDQTRPPFWKCWSCGKQGNAVTWAMKYRGLEYEAALEFLQIKTDSIHRRQDSPTQLPDKPPTEAWQIRSLQLIERAEEALWDERGKDVLIWLRARGLLDETIRTARFGYIPKNYREKPETWGIPHDDPHPLYFFKGLLIPGLIASKVWYLKMRPDNPRGGQKYKHVRGGKQALYRADHLMNNKTAVFCEGELDTLLLAQETKGLVATISLASATNGLNLATWGIYLYYPSRFVLAYDMDNAGNKGANKLSWLHDAQRLIIPTLRKGDKDLTDFYISGGNLYSLIESVLRPEAPIFVTWPEGMRPAAIQGQYWRNPENRIEAFYLPHELDQCLKVMQAIADPASEQV